MGKPARAAGDKPAARRTFRNEEIFSWGAVAVAVLLSAATLVFMVFGATHGQTSTARSVEFPLVAGQTSANGSFNFNGYAKGALTVTVPVGWKVVIQYSNASALRHSLDVIPYTGTQPDSAPPPAFAGASTKDLVDGIGSGKQETLTFTAAKAGAYEFLCGVLGHAQAGMWGRLIVSTAVKTPSVRPGAGPALKIR